MRNIPFGMPFIGNEEKQAVQKVLEGTTLTHGPLVKEFENKFAEYTKAPFAVAVSNCTAGLHLAYFYLGLGDGDEVIVPAQSHVATAHAVELVGAKAVFVDAEPLTGNIDISKIEQAITKKTKALSLVHYLGMPVDMDKYMAIAKKHKLFVVEDCALAIGTTYKGIHAGLHGDIGCFSFYPVKHITTAEGGMVVTKHKEVAQGISLYRAFGIDRNIVSERKIPGMYDVQKLGFNYRMNELSAALGIEQMKRVPEFLQKRQENYEALTKGLKEIKEVELLSSSHNDFQSSYYCHSMILKEPLQECREQIMEALKQKGVGTSIYYPKPIPHMTYYKEKYGYAEQTTFPIAARISNNCIALPVGPYLNVDDMEYIVSSAKAVLQEVKVTCP